MGLPSGVRAAIRTGSVFEGLKNSHVDHLNTPRLVADAAGTTVWKWDQAEPFGNNVADENPSGLGAFDLPLRLPGQYFDRETNLHYNYYRDYDPSIGRYGESDPIGLQGGLNTYAYVGGDPLGFIDRDGLQMTGDNRERPSERPGRERPNEPRPTTPSTSTGVSQAEREFCYAICIQRENERLVPKVTLACGVLTAVAGVGGFLAGGPAGAAGGVAGGLGLSAALIGGTVSRNRDYCRRQCFE